MLVPSSITRSCLILEVKGLKSLISTTFIAYFGEGREKLLNRKEWTLNTLLKDGEQSIIEPVNIYMSKKTCPLYYRDWSKMPTFGVWGVNYPKHILPEEIISLIPNSLYSVLI